jgi:hypothetical protein
MTWWRKLFGEPYDPEQDETIQALNRAAEKHHERAEEAKQRRNVLLDSMLPRSDEERRNGTHR